MPLTARERRLRRRARARTLQALYAWDLVPDGGLAAVSERIWTDLAVGAEERAAPLVAEILAAHGDIDKALAGVTTNWRPSGWRWWIGRCRAWARGIAHRVTPPRVVIQRPFAWPSASAATTAPGS